MPTPASPKNPRLRSADGTFSARGSITAKMLRRVWGLSLDTPAASMNTQLVQFIANDFTSDKVDTVNAVIRGVSVITSGLIARGHNLEVDKTTLKQLLDCAASKGQVPVKVNHGSGAEAVCGFLTNFQIVDNKLKADWNLLKSHPQKEQILEVAERMPKGVGLSASFLPPDMAETLANGRKAARCKELISVDYVTLPAANPDGMFSAKVDSSQTAMNPELLAAINEVISKALAPITTELASIKKQQALLANPPTLEEVAQMDEAQLAEIGLTPDDVIAALEAHAEQMADQGDNGEGEGEGEGEPIAGQGEGDNGEGELAGAGAPAAGATAPAAGATGLAALTKQIVELQSQITELKTGKARETEETLFASLEEKIEFLANENQALRESLKTGGKAATPSVDRNGIIFFSAKKNEGEFEKLVQLGIEEKKLPRAKAFQAAIAEAPAAYENYLVRLGVKRPAE